MKDFMRVIGVTRLTLMALLGLCMIAASASASEKKKSEIYTVFDPVQLAVANELSAFKERNSDRAYELASPELRKKFSSALKYATMMRITYWEIYDHASFRFLTRSSAPTHEIQKVEVTSSDGRPYIVLYKLVKRHAGKWLIDDLILLDREAQPV